MLAIAWLAKASFNSTTFMSDAERPARDKALREACTGPTPMMSGSQPETATLRMRARIGKFFARAYSSEHTSTALAPSVSGEEVPAVTVPSWSNASFKPASVSFVVSARMHPSRSTVALAA